MFTFPIQPEISRSAARGSSKVGMGASLCGPMEAKKRRAVLRQPQQKNFFSASRVFQAGEMFCGASATLDNQRPFCINASASVAVG
jgi:hypothetical protein